MRDANPVPTHQTRPPAAGAASLQEKLRRGEIGGQALGLIQLVAAQASSGCSGSAGVGPRADARGSDPRCCDGGFWERN